MWRIAERVLRSVALVHPSHGAVAPVAQSRRYRFDYSDLPWHSSSLSSSGGGAPARARSFHARFTGYGPEPAFSPPHSSRGFSTKQQGGRYASKHVRDNAQEAAKASGQAAVEGDGAGMQPSMASYAMAQVDSSTAHGAKGWHARSLNSIPGLGEIQNVRSLRDLMEVYPPLEGYLMAQLHMRDQQQFRRGLAAVVAGIVVLLIAFGQEISEKLTRDTGQVAADIVAHEELQLSLSELVTAVSTSLLTDRKVQDGVAMFGANLLADPYIRESAASLFVWALQSKSVRESVQWLLRHPETIDATNALFVDVLKDPGTQAAVRDLTYWVLKQPEVYKSVQDMFVTLFTTQPLLDEGAKYLMYGAHATMDDPEVIDHCARLTQQVLEDPRVQKQGGDTFWAALQWSLSPTAMFGDADASAKALADQRLKDMQRQAAVRAELAALKAAQAEREAKEAEAKAAAEAAAQREAAKLPPVPGLTPDMRPA